MLIGGLQKLTLIDYPGKLACTVFLIGCNFRCPWCYSRELVLPEEIKKQLHPVKSRKAGSPLAKFNRAGIPKKEFFDFLKERKKILEGVVICGGEATINKNLPDFIKRIKKMGYLVKLDTNGSNPEMLKKLISEKLIDYVAMDVKSSLAQFPISNFQFPKYDEVAGAKVDLEKIKKSIEIIKNSGIDYEFRTTIAPKLLQLKDIAEIAKQLKGAKKYFLQQFRPEKTIDPKYEKYKPFSQKQLKAIQEECEKYLPTKIRI